MKQRQSVFVFFKWEFQFSLTEKPHVSLFLHKMKKKLLINKYTYR